MFNDPLQTWGDAPLGPPLNVLARDMSCKVVGATFTFPQGRSGFKTDLDCLGVS